MKKIFILVVYKDLDFVGLNQSNRISRINLEIRDAFDADFSSFGGI